MKKKKYMEVVGRRKRAIRKGAAEELNEFLKLCTEFRKDISGGIPRGIYKFRTFEEENEWTIRTLAGQKPPADRQP